MADSPATQDTKGTAKPVDPKAFAAWKQRWMPNVPMPQSLQVGGPSPAPGPAPGPTPDEIPGEGRQWVPLVVAPVPPQPRRKPRLAPPHRRFEGAVHPVTLHPVVRQEIPSIGGGPTYPIHKPAPYHKDDSAPRPPATTEHQPPSDAATETPVPPVLRPHLRHPTDKPITVPTPVGQPTVCKGADGKTVTIQQLHNGRVQIECPPPPLTEITFSGGGGKGNVYPGVVKALERNGALAEVKELHGASAGSITAALLASGMTADEFEKFNDSHDFLATIGKDAEHTVPGIHLPIGSKGEAFQDLIAGGMRGSLIKTIDAYLKQHGGKPKDPAVLQIAERLKAGNGPTFRDLRVLSKEIPTVKEVVIDATKNSDDPKRPMESVILDADTNPDMNVADAVHASAALPPVFNPKNLTTKDGQTAPYRDGGLMNNAPSSDTIGGKRDVDPVASSRNLTLVFQDDDSNKVMDGHVKPTQVGTFDDAALGAPGAADLAHGVIDPKYLAAREIEYHSKKALAQKYGLKYMEWKASEYSVNKTLSEHKKSVFQVPLIYEDRGKKVDDSGAWGGTLNFNMPADQKAHLRPKAEAEMDENLKQGEQPRSLTFASEEQALNMVPRDVLARMVGQVPGAKETMAFRDAVAQKIARLETLAGYGPEPDKTAIQGMMAELDKLTEGNPERIAYVGREMNRSGKLDAVFEQLRKGKKDQWFGKGVADAGLAVNDQVEAEQMAMDVDKNSIIPLMTTTAETPAGLAELEMLTASEERLRPAKSYKVIRDAIAPAARFYAGWKKGATDTIDRGPFITALSASFHKAAQLATAEH